MERKKIVIIGAGNMAWHLAHQFAGAGHKVVQIYNRTKAAAESLANEVGADFVSSIEDITKDADIYIVAVSDHGIDDIILELRLPGKVVAHTSGAVPLKGMEHITEEAGIFYPLQTLTKGNIVDFKQIPILIESDSAKAKYELTALADTVSNKVQELDSHKRRSLHVAAVFVNNFTNYMFDIAENITEREGLNFDLLQPLMQETVNRLQKNKPADVQTGPAKRGDFKTIEQHLTYLNGSPEFKETYLVLTESIMSIYKDAKAKNPEADEKEWDFGDNFDDELLGEPEAGLGEEGAADRTEVLAPVVIKPTPDVPEDDDFDVFSDLDGDEFDNRLLADEDLDDE